jgi:hypothetical protein
MGRKRTAEEYQRRAEENGWVLGAHEEEDSKQQTKDEPHDRYKGNQQDDVAAGNKQPQRTVKLR